MKIIITMSGIGSRFKNIGIKKPKYKIVANGKSLFEWSMLSLKDFFDEKFIFISRDTIADDKFIKLKCSELGIKNYEIILLDNCTDGQATTAYAADEFIDNHESCLIYNIDTYIEPMNIKKIDILNDYDGFIPVIRAEGDRWSFVKVNSNNKVIEVAEKKPISNLASVGLYYFKCWEKYKQIYDNNRIEIKQLNKEVYIAPMYQYMIDENLHVGIKIIDSNNVHILGTPEEIELFDSDFLKSNN